MIIFNIDFNFNIPIENSRPINFNNYIAIFHALFQDRITR